VALADGAHLVTTTDPDASVSAMRIVVHTGSAADPADRAGTAHLVEHLIFHGTYQFRGDDFDHEVRAAGGTINAFTSAVATTFVLDAPCGAFPPLAEKFINLVTNPAITAAHLSSELGVVQSEGIYNHHAGGLIDLLDPLLFSSAESRDILGKHRSRLAIGQVDLADFISEHYRPSNLTFVIAGTLSAAEATALVERSDRLAPEFAEPSHGGSETLEAALPLTQSSWAPLTFAAFGYALHPGQASACRSAAALLQLRLTRALVVQKPLASSIGVACVTIRKQDLLVAQAFSRSFDASDLPETLK
jgi:predicted Zn-dependent peptidase